MKNVILVMLLCLIACTKNSKTSSVQKSSLAIKSKSHVIKLFCGHIMDVGEGVETNTLAIEIFDKNKVNIIRQYEQSDVPTTSAFVGKFKTEKEISANYNEELTMKNKKQSLAVYPQGEIFLTLECSDYINFKDCKVSGKGIGEIIIQYPGWNESTKQYPENMPCNLVGFKKS